MAMRLTYPCPAQSSAPEAVKPQLIFGHDIGQLRSTELTLRVSQIQSHGRRTPPRRPRRMGLLPSRPSAAGCPDAASLRLERCDYEGGVVCENQEDG